MSTCVDLNWAQAMPPELVPLPPHPERWYVWTEAEQKAIAHFADVVVDKYRDELIAEFDKRHEENKHLHNYWACLAREFRDGKL